MTLIILPFKNEENTIERTCSRLFFWCENRLEGEFEILFINDGSTDKSQEIIKSFENYRCRVCKNMFDRGKGSALKTAFITSEYIYKLSEDDIIVFLDSDGQIDSKEIGSFLKLMNVYDADVVIGNKRHKYSVTRYNFKRTVVSQTYNFIIRTLFGIKYEDTQCGIKIFRKYALDKVIEKVTIKKFAFDLELIVALRQMGMKIVDAPVKVKDQMNSGSVTIGNIYRTFFDTISIWKKMITGYYSK